MDNRMKAILLGMQLGVFLDRPQLGFLYDLALAAPDGIGVECGVARGSSLMCWAAARYRRGPVIAVDALVYPLWEYISVNLAKHGPNIIYLNGLSWVVGAMMAKHQRVAFAFIDAGHRKEEISRDLEVWPKAIMLGGIIAFDDYAAAMWPAVQPCVDEWQAAAQWEGMGRIGNVIAYRRCS